MNKKTWTLTLTPEGEAASTLAGVSHDTMVRSVYDLMHGGSPVTARKVAGTVRNDVRNAA